MRVVVVGIVTAVLGIGLAGSAHAQDSLLQLSVSPVDALVGDAVTITANGTTSDTSPLYLFYEINGTTCGVTQSAEYARPNVHAIDILYPAAGTFSMTAKFTPEQSGAHHICAYLYLARDNTTTQPPRTLVEADVTVKTKPGTDKDGDGKPDSSDRCPLIASALESGCPPFTAPVITASRQAAGKGAYRFSVACNQACTITFSGTIAGIKLQPGNGTTASTKATRFTIRLTKVNLAKLKKLLKKRRSITGSITVSALDTPTARTTGESPTPLIAKRSLTITR